MGSTTQSGANTLSRYTSVRFKKSFSLRLDTGYMVLSGKVIAFRKVLIELFIKSTKGSFTGYFSEPQSTLCSSMWNTPVESSGRVLKPTQKSLFASPLSIQQSCVPTFSCRISTNLPPSSADSLILSTRKPPMISPTR